MIWFNETHHVTTSKSNNYDKYTIEDQDTSFLTFLCSRTQERYLRLVKPCTIIVLRYRFSMPIRGMKNNAPLPYQSDGIIAPVGT